MKRLFQVLIMSVAALTLTGCEALQPPTLVTLPWEGETSTGEENLPAVVEITLTDVNRQDDAASEEQNVNMTRESAQESFDAANEASAAHAENTGELFLTGEDENYCYEAAYRLGDDSALNEQQRQVLSAAEQIVAQCAQMSPYEQALYVHDYLTGTVTYGFSEDPYNAYGALVERMAVCQGYAYAYKLCMDLLQIPCVTVGGSADNGEEVLSHAWNMIQLDGQWYHVDVTWDDATTSVDYGSWCHLYFCVDDAFIAQNHTWTDLVQDFHGMGQIPVASDPSGFYFRQVKQILYSQEELEEAFDIDYGQGLRSGEYCCYGFEPDSSFIGSYAAGALISQKLGDYVLLFIVLQ